MIRKIALALLVPLSVCGIVVTVFLVRDHLAVYGGGVAEGLFCGGVGRFDCNQVAAHESSWLWGLPLAVWGLAYFIAVTGLSVIAVLLRESDRRETCRLGMVFCGAAFLFDVYLGYVMVVRIGYVCLNCVITYGINVLLFLCFRGLSRVDSPRRGWWSALPSVRTLIARRGEEYYRELMKGILQLLSAGGIAFALFTVLPPLRELREYGERETQRFLDRMKGSPDVDMSVFAGQPALGPVDAGLSIVLVGDFQCSFCRSLASQLEHYRSKTPEKIRLVFVNSPISSLCNPAIPQPVHADACALAAAGECAGVQGKFWEFHDLLFMRIPFPAVSRQSVGERLQELNLDMEAFQECLGGETGKKNVEEDVALCGRLGLTSTPSIVINGYMKRGGFFPWMLKAVMEKLLSESP